MAVFDAVLRHRDIFSGVYFVGGSCISGCYFGHRTSEDFDFFVPELENVVLLTDSIQKSFPADGLVVDKAKDYPNFKRLFIGVPAPEGMKRVKVEIAMDSSLPPTRESIVVPSLERLAAMKFCAVLGRSDLKDLVDLYFIRQHDPKSFSGGFMLAPSIDGGLTDEALAWCLSQVQIPDVPPAYMRVRLEMGDLRKFRDGMVSKLRARALEGSDGRELI